jgi:hypothetical protein
MCRNDFNFGVFFMEKVQKPNGIFVGFPIADEQFGQVWRQSVFTV